MPLFGFPIDTDADSKELLTSKRFLAHAGLMLDMIDTALNMLGPDYETLTVIMNDLGKKHVRYGVTSDMFPFMGEALVETLEEFLSEEEFPAKKKEAWIDVYGKLSGDMILGQSLA